MFNKKFIIFDYFVLLILFYSLYLGYNYSLYNQDYHHWSYILSTYIDFKNQFRLFKDIYIQYGIGQIIFFFLIDNFYFINIFSIGVLTSIVYSLNLLLIYIILSSITSRLVSFSLFFIIFLIHPFAVVPWPDYLSGLCLNLFFFFFLRTHGAENKIICAFFIFLAIIFRSTYLVSIFLSIFLFSLISYLLYKKFLFIKLFSLIFLFIAAFLILLNFDNNFFLYFSQSFNLNYYILERRQLSENYIPEYTFFFSFLKIIFIWMVSIINIFKIQNLIFFIVLFFNLWFVFFLKKEKNKMKFLFVSLLGITGFIQSILNYDVFRNINSTMGTFIVFCFLLKKYNLFFFLKKKIIFFKLFNILLIFFIFKLAINFPNNSTTFKYEKHNNKDFNSLNIDFFSNDKKIVTRISEYYNYLQTFLCASDYKVINLTGDFSLSYLCNSKNSKSFSAMQFVALLNNNPIEYERIFLKKILYKNEILLSSKEINDSRFILLSKRDSPHVPKYLYGDVYIYKSSDY